MALGQAVISETERREWLRIDDRLLLEYRLKGTASARPLVQSSDAIAAAIHDFITKPTEELLERTQAAEAEFPLQPWVMKIDWAMSLILNSLARLTPGGMAIPQLTDVNISATGIRFFAPDPFHEGDQLDLKLILPPFSPIQAAAEVIRVTRSFEDGKERYEIATSFTTISSDAQERLIQYIISLQAKRLRTRNGQSQQHEG
jgi:hypothetical protein